MKKLLILGAGTGGTIMANKMRKMLPKDKWEISIVDQHRTHYYQPGFLFIPFGSYTKKDVVKQKDKFLPKGINIIYSKIEKINHAENSVLLEKNKVLNYDYLIVATGTRTAPGETEGLLGDLWYKEIFDFYTIEGALALADYFKTWKGGKLVVNITEIPFKCPVAPLEFVFLADAFFTKKGIRDKVDITYVTPLPGAFTKPKATKMLSELLKEKNIKIIPDFSIMEVDNETKEIVDFGEQRISFDCLVSIPTNMGDDLIERSGMGDDLNFIPTDKHSLKAKIADNIFVIGDASDLPASKAGSVVHFEADILEKNMKSAIEGKPLTAKFDGHANCYIETGFGKGTLIDFNYEVEPLPGTYPVPVLGPFGLLKVTRMNHLGKLMFKWIYWNILLKAREMPIGSDMQMAGKKA